MALVDVISALFNGDTDMEIVSFVFENSGRFDSSMSVMILSWTKGFQILVPIKVIMTFRCTEAEAIGEVKGPFNAPRPEANGEVKGPFSAPSPEANGEIKGQFGAPRPVASAEMKFRAVHRGRKHAAK